jgi:hypothetical protein
MRTASIIMAVVLLLPISFLSSATHVEYSTIKNNCDTSTNNGTVTLKILRGFNEKGFLSRIGYSMVVNNQYDNSSFYYQCHVTSYNLVTHTYSNETYPHYAFPGFKFTDSVLAMPFPTFPAKISITITTNTSTSLSLTRTGILFGQCFIIFTSGQESITGQI